MAGSVNRVIIIGNVVRDPEIRTLGSSGDRVASLTVATSESWKDRATGERKEKSEFHRVSIFNEALVRVAEAYVKKGSLIHIEGALQTRKWTDNAGVEKYSTEIVLQKFRGELTMLGGRAENNGSSSASSAEKGGGGDGGFGGADDFGDAIPFVTRWGVR
jgi:single-strand DNA-binding protein